MNFSKIEAKWQKKWQDAKLFEAKPNSKKEKFYMLFAYPTVSGTLHVGHGRSYSITDIIARYHKMKGLDVFFPVGYHATGVDCIRILDLCKENLEDACKKYDLKKEIAKKFKTPLDVEKYLEKRMNIAFKKMGFSLDFRTSVSTIDPQYNKFIQWQYNYLKNNTNYLTIGDYTLPYCPKCKHVVSIDSAEMDILKGGNAEQNEYTALKFKLGNEFVIAATLRPETVFGQTNLWIDPKITYAKVKVGKETWIMSKEAAEKLKYQKDDVKITGKVKGSELIDKKVMAPMIHTKIPILPSKFCDPNLGTGIVTSVPSDAPHDYMGLVDLWAQGKYKEVKVIPIIKSEKYGDEAAITICKKFKIKNQLDPKLEEVKKEIYKEGFHSGKMNKNCGKYSGKLVKFAKDQVKKELIKTNEADLFYDLSEEVVCRCRSTVIMKKLDDQWFIDYSVPKWKTQAKKCVSKMNIYPEEYKEELPGIIDWFDKRPLIRKRGLGTEFPFKKGWLVEALSDSTIYMSFYPISKYFNEKKLKLNELTYEFFDYVFHGKGKAKNKTWENVKKDFNKYYPLNLNFGGKEHKSAHFPMFIFHHVAIFPEKYWPKGIFVNWHLILEGQKISKSKGNVVFWDEAIKKYGADVVRLYTAGGLNPWADFDWRSKEIEVTKKKYLQLEYLIQKYDKKAKTTNGKAEKWLISKVNSIIKQTKENYEKMRIKKAVDSSFYNLLTVIKKYESMVENENTNARNKAIETFFLLNAPVMPHISEEAWETFGKKGFISEQKFPDVNKKSIDTKLEREFGLLDNVNNDIRTVLQLAKIKPKKITLIVAPTWKRKVLKTITKITNPNEIVKKAMKDSEVKKNGKQAVKFIQYVAKHKGEFTDVISEKEEFAIVSSFKQQIAKQFNAKVDVVTVNKTDNPKKNNAIPMKPAIFVE